jgi:eukaryotic-like serine/threonine-protein kinase
MAVSSVPRDTFLKNLRRSGLIAERALEEFRARFPKTERGRVIARVLVDWGLITKFQAELLLIGRTQGFFLGPYKILDQLGQGGMGRVYQALHQAMNRVVALKVLTPSVTRTKRAQEFFLREVQAAAQLRHPNIITAYDAGQIDGRHYLAMEYIDGPNLEELVRVQGPLPAGLACELIRQAAAGLQHAFELGMLHRDIKPANLLVSSGALGSGAASGASSLPQVKILDFGLARLHDPSAVGAGAKTILVRDNVVLGTPDFISPEQARNVHKVDIRSDLYSLGCTFYWLLTGEVPFPGGNTLEKLLRHSTEAPTPVRQLHPQVPVAVAEIVHRLLAKNPADRFPTPQALIDTLTPLAQPATLVWEKHRQTLQLATSTPGGSVQEAPAAAVDTWPQAAGMTPLGNDSLIVEVVMPRRTRWSRWALAGAASLMGAAIGAGVWALLQLQ